MTSDIDDDFDDLKAAFAAATPRPDAAVKAAHLALAQENFDHLQGSRQAARLNPERPKRGVFQGVFDMLNIISTKGGLTMTTALVAVGFLALTPQGQSLWRAGAPLIGEGSIAPDPVVLDDVAPPIDSSVAPVTAEPVTQEPVVVAPLAPLTEIARDETTPEQTTAGLVDNADTGQANPGAEVAETAIVDLTQSRDQAQMSDAEAAPPMAEAPSPVIGLGRMNADAMAGGAGALDGAFSIEQGFADTRLVPDPDTEAFATAEVNPLKITAEEPVSTFPSTSTRPLTP